MKEIVHYQSFNFEILSEIPLQLPPLSASSSHDTARDRVSITYGSVCKECKLEYSTGLIEYGFSDDHADMLIHIPRIADVSIDRDNQVVVETATERDDSIVGQVITSLVMVLILKRKLLVTVHGSAVSTGANAIVLVGERGSGKSTTAAALAGQGYHMMCDDIVPIGLAGTAKSAPIVYPGIPRPKLLEGTFRELFGDSWEMHTLFDGIDKYQVPIETQIGSVPLLLICILCEDPHCEALIHRQLQGSEKIAHIMRHVSVLQGIESRQEIFMHALRVFQDTRVYEIRRPRGVSTVMQVVRLIETLSQNA